MLTDAQAKLQGKNGLKDQEREMPKLGKFLVIVISGQTHKIVCLKYVGTFYND